MIFCDSACIMCDQIGTNFINFSRYHRVCQQHTEQVFSSGKIKCKHCKSTVRTCRQLYIKENPSIQPINDTWNIVEALPSQLTLKSKCPHGRCLERNYCPLCNLSSSVEIPKKCVSCANISDQSIELKCNSSHFQCFRCFQDELPCKICPNYKHEMIICRQCGNGCQPTVGFCIHHVCFTCKENKSFCPDCRVSLEWKNHCPNCNERIERVLSLDCCHWGCNKCKQNIYCFQCAFKNNSFIKAQIPITCSICKIESIIFAVLKCGHFVCFNCRSVPFINLDYSCIDCCFQNPGICFKCKKQSIWEILSEGSTLKQCCQTKFCLYCYGEKNILYHGCKPIN